MFGKGNFSAISLFLTLIVASAFQSILATKEELDERILSPKSDENDEVPNFLSEGVIPEDRWHFPFVYLPPSCYEAILSQNLGGGGGEFANYIKRSFQPWGGKRSKLTDYYRRLSNWGGKRDPIMGRNSQSQKSDVPTARRSTFNPWGG